MSSTAPFTGVLDTAKYRTLELELLNGLIDASANFNFDPDGRLQVDALTASSADLTIIQNQLATLTGIAVTQSAEVAGIQNQLATGIVTVSGGGGGSGSNVTLSGVSSGVTLPVSGNFYPSVQPVSLVGDTLASLPVNLTTSVSLASGQSVGVSSLPAVTGNVGITSLPSVTISNPTTNTPTLGSAVSIAGGQSLTSARSWNLSASTDSLTAAISSIPLISLASGQSVGVSSLPAVSLSGGSINSLTLTGATGITLPVSGTFYPATQPVSNSNLDTLLSSRFSKTDTLAGGQITLNGSNVTLPVSGTFYQATQPVSNSNLDTLLSSRFSKTDTLAGGLITLNGSNATLPVSGNFYQATQPVSGSLTATAYGSDSLGTLHQLRTDSLGDLITARTWNLAQGTDTVYASLGSQTLPVSGSFYQATQPVSGNLGRTWNLAQGTDTLYASLGSQTLSVTGTFYQATQPVSGTVSLGAGASSGTLVAGAFNKASGTGTISGGSVTAGTPASLPAATKTLSILNNSTSGVLYVSTSTLPSATNGLALAAGAGYDLSYIISSTIYVNASTGTVNYGVVYA